MDFIEFKGGIYASSRTAITGFGGMAIKFVKDSKPYIAPRKNNYFINYSRPLGALRGASCRTCVHVKCMFNFFSHISDETAVFCYFQWFMT